MRPVFPPRETHHDTKNREKDPDVIFTGDSRDARRRRVLFLFESHLNFPPPPTHANRVFHPTAVDGGKSAVMFDRFRGVLPKAVGEGTHFLIPFVQSPTIYDIRTRPKSITSVTGTKDLQQVNLTLRMLHRPDVERLSEIHVNLGPEYEERVLPSIGNEVLKATVAQFNADQLLTMRDAVSEKVSSALRVRAKDFGIVLEDVALTHLSFGVEYSRAIEVRISQLPHSADGSARLPRLFCSNPTTVCVIQATNITTD